MSDMFKRHRSTVWQRRGSKVGKANHGSYQLHFFPHHLHSLPARQVDQGPEINEQPARAAFIHSLFGNTLPRAGRNERGEAEGGEAVPLLALAGLSRTQFYFLPFPVPRCHVSIATVLAQGALPPLACFQIYNFSPLVRPACLCHFPVPSPLTASPLAIPHFPPIFCTIQFSNGQKNQCGERLL